MSYDNWKLQDGLENTWDCLLCLKAISNDVSPEDHVFNCDGIDRLDWIKDINDGQKTRKV